MIKGTGASGGIGIGTIIVIKDQKPVFERRRIRDTDAELNKLKNAVASFVKETEKLAQKVEKDAGKNEAGILRGHIILLKDPVLTTEIEKLIKGGECAEAAVEQICNMFISVFSANDDAVTKQRAADLEDLKSRLIKHLLGLDSMKLSPLPKGTVICAKELTPSMTATMDKDNVAGFITEKGGETSHCAIIARAMEIPAVLGAEGILSKVKNGQTVILNGDTGEIILSPKAATLKKYSLEKDVYDKRKELLKNFKGKQTVTADGSVLSVLCNIGNPNDADKVISGDGEGIGLMRTEFIFMDRNNAPDEEEQFEVYRTAALKMQGKPVVIRTLDIGGDKEVPYLDIGDEENPFLGQRAIRYCMAHPDILSQQLRAILRASAYGNIKILVPMISDISELRFVKKMTEKIKQEFSDNNIKFDENIKLGVMIETPSACMIADLLARECDFFSIGTNDLIQYTMAADRGNSSVSHLYSVLKPSVLRAIKHTISCAKNENITVEMCGEAAANKLITPLLISFGLDKFSVSPSSVLSIRKEISRYSKSDADKITDKVMKMSTSEEIKKYLVRCTEEH